MDNVIKNDEVRVLAYAVAQEISEEEIALVSGGAWEVTYLGNGYDTKRDPMR